MEQFDSSAIRVVIFDLFGTLVRIHDKRAPFRQLIQIGESHGRKPSSRDARVIMGQPVGLAEAADFLGIILTDVERERLRSDLRAELSSITPFADAISALQELKDRGFKLAVCSNLAMDYALPALSVLPKAFEAYIWSFQVGALKPSQAIYASACTHLCNKPSNVLMVGDTLEADVEGPRSFGMQALLLHREKRSSESFSIASLSRLCEILDRPPNLDVI